MAKVILSVIIVFSLFISEITLPFYNVLGMDNTANANIHWAAPYANNIMKRLASIKTSLLDINAQELEVLLREISRTDQLDGNISAGNWNKLLDAFLINNTSSSGLTPQLANNNYVTREEAIINIISILKEKQYIGDLSTDSSMSLLKKRFSDDFNIGSKKSDLILLAVHEGLISGFDDDSLRPEQYLRNSEAITIMEKVCQKYGLPESQWYSEVRLLQMDEYIQVGNNNIDVTDAMWANDNSLLLAYTVPQLGKREAAKIFIDKNKTVKALEYTTDNMTKSFLNDNAFNEERGYISANTVVWSNQQWYVNTEGQLKSIYIPYVNYWISQDKNMVLALDENGQEVYLYDFLNETTVPVREYFRWADKTYHRDVKWSPNSRYIISSLFKPEDDLGIGEKSRFAVFDRKNGHLVKIINNSGYYSFYPAWSDDENKIAFFRVKVDDKQLQMTLNNMVDNYFNLPAKEMGIYNIETGEEKYYPHPSIILGKSEDSIIWAPTGDKLYIETATDKRNFLTQLESNNNLNIGQIPNDVWELDVKSGNYTKILSGEIITKENKPLYAVTKNICSVSPNGRYILYVKQLHNLTVYENTVPEFIVKDLKTEQEHIINQQIITDHWWLDDGRLIFVENEMLRSSRAQTTYNIKELNANFKIREIAAFTQFPTSISISPDKRYLMIHQYRAAKDVKLIELK